MAKSLRQVTRTIVQVPVGDLSLEGMLSIPQAASGLVLFSHGSGSSRHSPRNQQVAEVMQDANFATLLIDLLSAEEEAIDRVTAELRFDIPLLATRLEGIIDWLQTDEGCKGLSIGVIGSSTGAGSALIAAAERSEVKAVVSRGGRPDLAMRVLRQVTAPTLLIVGSKDTAVIELNEQALAAMQCEKRLELVEGASHLFEEPGTLIQASHMACKWFTQHL